MLPFRSLLAGLAAFVAFPLSAQTPAHAPASNRPAPALLRPYLSCKLPLGPELVQHTALPQAPMTRTAQTLTGPKPIRLVDGVFAAFAYPNAGPFANVKIEQLPAANYVAEKNDVISEFDAINAKGEDTQRNYALKPTLNGFEIYGFDRTVLDGQVLGIYLFFDNVHHVSTTAYFLNAPESLRKFHSVAEYTELRESFLNAYTVCVRKQLSGTPAAAAKPATRSAPSKRKH